MFKLRLAFFLVLLSCNIMTTNACTDIQVVPLKAAPGSLVKFICKTDVEVKQIALEISGKEWNASIPYLYDDGTHGDITADDNTYSLLITAPTVTGAYKVKFFSILPDQSELESDQITFSVE